MTKVDIKEFKEALDDVPSHIQDKPKVEGLVSRGAENGYIG